MVGNGLVVQAALLEFQDFVLRPRHRDLAEFGYSIIVPIGTEIAFINIDLPHGTIGFLLGGSVVLVAVPLGLFLAVERRIAGR